MTNRPTLNCILHVYQDGADFYDEDIGHIFTGTIPTKDFDMKSAHLNREQFIAWAEKEGFEFFFVK